MIRRSVLACALAGAAFTAMPANALTFNLINTGGAEAGTQALAGFQAAASYWSSVLTDNVTVNLEIGFQSLGSNILGQTGSSRAVAYDQDIYTALAADRTSALDNSAVAHLPTLTPSPSEGVGGLGVVVNAGDAEFPGLYSSNGTRYDNDGSANNIGLAVNTSVMKALGLTHDANGDALDPNAVDGSITFSSDFAFDFDPTDGITSGESDFIGVAIHEIGHALGFVSGVDSYDYYSFPDTPTDAPGLLDDYLVGSTLDLFRYSADGLDWSTSDSDKYFSIDGGATKFNGNASFATGVYNGDGDQASHWKEPNGACTGFVGIMNPYLCDGTGAIITDDDVAAMDALGWDLNFDALANPGYTKTTAQVYADFHGAVPEPASWALMLGGFGLVGGALRRRTAKVSFGL